MRAVIPRRWAWALAAVAVWLSGCAEPVDPHVTEARAYIKEVTGADLPKPGRLQIHTSGVTTDGRIAKIRGQVENRFSDTVHGVRYVVTIYQEGSPPQVLDRWQEQVDTTITPGQRVGMQLDVDSMYFGSMGPRPFIIDAQPVTLGDKPMPPPEGWR